eukprot:9903683-Alexandrium_andersonii.AAC.1
MPSMQLIIGPRGWERSLPISTCQSTCVSAPALRMPQACVLGLGRPEHIDRAKRALEASANPRRP